MLKGENPIASSAVSRAQILNQEQMWMGCSKEKQPVWERS